MWIERWVGFHSGRPVLDGLAGVKLRKTAVDPDQVVMPKLGASDPVRRFVGDGCTVPLSPVDATFIPPTRAPA